MLIHVFLTDGSWFLPHQSMYASAAQVSPCQFRASPTLKRQKSAPYTLQRPKSASVSPPPHSKYSTLNPFFLRSKYQMLYFLQTVHTFFAALCSVYLLWTNSFSHQKFNLPRKHYCAFADFICDVSKKLKKEDFYLNH